MENFIEISSIFIYLFFPLKKKVGKRTYSIETWGNLSFSFNCVPASDFFFVWLLLSPGTRHHFMSYNLFFLFVYPASMPLNWVIWPCTCVFSRACFYARPLLKPSRHIGRKTSGALIFYLVQAERVVDIDI